MKRPALTLAWKAILSVIAILLPISAMFLLNYWRTYDYVRESTLNDLRVLAEAYEVQVYEFMEMGKQRAEDFASDGFIREELLRLMVNGDEDSERLVDHLRRNKLPLDEKLDTISVISIIGRVVASTDGSLIGKDASKEPFFVAGKEGSAFVESHIIHEHKDPVGSELFASALITDRVTGGPLGVLVNTMPLSSLDHLLGGGFARKAGALSSDMGWRESMETYLVNKDGFFITDSVFVKDAILKQKVETDPVDVCLATRGEMVGFYPDYRGVMVAGSSMCLPSMDWTLLVEIDADIVMSALNKARRDAMLTALLVIGVITLLLAFFYRSIVRQIWNLSDGAARLAAGDYNVAIPVTSRDEMGSLSESFNLMATEIGERNAELKRSEASLSEAQRIAHVGNWVWDMEKGTLVWSDEIYRIFGLRPGEFDPTYEVFLAAVHPGDREVVTAAVDKALKGDGGYSVDHRVVLPDGTVRIVHEEGIVSFGASGKAVRMVGTVQDITEMRRAEEGLRDSEERFRNLVETSSDWVWEVDKEAVYSYISPKVKDVLGYDADEVVGKTPFEFMPAEEAERVAAIYARIAEAREPILLLENINLHKDGRQVVLETSGVPIYDKDGDFCGYRGMDRDITKRKEAAERLRRSQQKIRLHIEQTPLAVIEWDVDFRFTEWNDAAEKIFGFSRGEVLGRTVADLILPEEVKEHVDQIRQALLSGEGGERSTNENVRKDGSRIMCEWYNTPLVDESGATIGVASMAQDITARVRAEERILHLDRLLNAIRSINRLITRTTDPETLLGSACDILTDVSEYRMAWIGAVEEGHKRVVPVASSGFDEGYLDSFAVTWDDEPTGMGPVGIAIKTMEPCVIQNMFSDSRFDLWKEAAKERGYQSVAAVPINMSGGVYGVLNVYSSQDEGFSDDELGLLDEVAGDIAFALTAIEGDEMRRFAEEKLKKSNDLLYLLRRAQYRFISSVEGSEIFEEVLRDVLLLTESEYGFIGEVEYTDDNRPFIRIDAIADIGMDEEQKAFFEERSTDGIEFRDLDNLIGAVIGTGTPVISNDPANDSRSGGLPDGHPDLNSFLGLPFFSGTGMVGMVGLANREGGYDEEMVDFLKPLLYTCGNVIKALKNEETRREAEETSERERRRFYRLLNSLPVIVYLQAPDHSIRFANEKFIEEYGDPGDSPCYQAMWQGDEPCEECPTFEVFETGKPTIWESRREGRGKTFQVYDYPFTDVDGSPLVLEVSMDITGLKNVEAELHELIVEMTNIEDRERKKFSEVLHEGIGQNLAAIKLAIMGKMKTLQLGKEEGFDRIVSIIDDTISSTRAMTADLYPAILDDMGFEDSLEWYSKSVMEPNGIKVVLNFSENVSGMSEEAKRALFHICRESFQNIMKYASASRVEVDWRTEGGGVRLSVKDNGVGFSIEEVKRKSKRGFGQILMREWANSLGGELSISSTPGKGTEVVVVLPSEPREGLFI